MDRNLFKRELSLSLVTFILCALLLSAWALAQCENCDQRNMGGLSPWNGARLTQNGSQANLPGFAGLISGSTAATTGATGEQGKSILPGNESESCDDDNPCTIDTRGDKGCQHDPVSCDDGNSATEDHCTSFGCVHVAIGGQSPQANNSGSESTNPPSVAAYAPSLVEPAGEIQEAVGNVSEEANVTEESLPLVCDDGNPCTNDISNDNECLFSPRDCSDGNDSTEDYCLDGTCVNAPRNEPQDGDELASRNNTSAGDNALAENNTTAVSESSAALALHNMCSDGDPCTIDVFNASAPGKCDHMPRDCDDGDACTTDTCENGRCVNTPNNCNDGDPATFDYCYQGVCYHIASSCDDGDGCTHDTYNGSACIHIPQSCDDGNACTIDTCKNGTCSHEKISCDDGNPCTDDRCYKGHCINHWRCDDDNPCTVDYCDPKWGCIHTPAACEGGKTCIDGTCRYPYYYGYYYPYALPASAAAPANSYTIPAGTAISLPWGLSVTAIGDLRVENAIAYPGVSPFRFVRAMGAELAMTGSQNKPISELAQMIGLSWNEAAFSLTLIKPDGSVQSPQGDNVNVVHLLGWNYDYYFLKSPAPGNWTVQVTPTNAASSGTVFSLITGLVKGASP